MNPVCTINTCLHDRFRVLGQFPIDSQYSQNPMHSTDTRYLYVNCVLVTGKNIERIMGFHSIMISQTNETKSHV